MRKANSTTKKKVTLSKERIEAVETCRRFHRLCLEQKLYLRPNCSRTELAHIMGTNHVYFCRRIKLGSGLSLNHFIKAIRMTIAYQLLKSTNYDMTKILTECGYTDKSSFYRAFHERFHCAPSDVRRRFFAN